jgi:membrane associated rhomboid family serine protease
VLQAYLTRNIEAQRIFSLLALQPPLVARGMVWQLVTYMFLHGGTMHILFNMLLLWMMGREVEMTLGGRTFLRLFFVCGVVAGLCSMVMWNSVVLGASGAVLGILAAYGQLFPDRIILAFFIVPMQVRHFIWVVAALDLLGAVAGGGRIAHLAHIGGLFTGIILMRTGLYRRPLVDIAGWRRRRRLARTRSDKARVDAILDKVSRDGIQSLTGEEKRFLESMRGRR